MNFRVKLTDIIQIQTLPLLRDDSFFSRDGQNEGYILHTLNLLGKGQLMLGDNDQSRFENVFMHISLKLQSNLDLQTQNPDFINPPNQNTDFAFAYFQARNAKIINSMNLWSGYAVSMMQNPGQFNLVIDSLENTNLQAAIEMAQLNIDDALYLNNNVAEGEPRIAFSMNMNLNIKEDPNFQAIQEKFQQKVFNP